MQLTIQFPVISIQDAGANNMKTRSHYNLRQPEAASSFYHNI